MLSYSTQQKVVVYRAAIRSSFTTGRSASQALLALFTDPVRRPMPRRSLSSLIAYGIAVCRSHRPASFSEQPPSKDRNHTTVGVEVCHCKATNPTSYFVDKNRRMKTVLVFLAIN